MEASETTNREIDRPGAWNARQWIVVGFMCAIAVIAYMQRGAAGLIDEPVTKEFELSSRESFWLLAAFAWGYLVFQIPTGWLTDRLGTRRTLTVTAALWSLLLAGLALCDGFASSWLVWFAVGGVQSFVFTGATRGLREWLPDTTWARANGLLTCSMFLGGGITAYLTVELLLTFSWREIYVLYGLVGLLWAIVFGWWFRSPAAPSAALKSPGSVASPPAMAAMRMGNVDLTIWGLLCMPVIWPLLGQQVFRNAPHVFFSTLFSKFLREHHHVELLNSGRLTSVPLISTLAGCLISGYVVDQIYRRTGNRSASRRIAAIFGLSLAGFAVLASLWPSDPVGVTLVMSIGAFGSAFGGVAAFTVAMDIGRERTGTVFGLMNTAGNLGAAVATPIISEIVDRTHNWTFVVVLCGGMYLLAALCWLRLRPGVGSQAEPSEAEAKPLAADVS